MCNKAIIIHKNENLDEIIQIKSKLYDKNSKNLAFLENNFPKNDEKINENIVIFQNEKSW